MFWIMIFADSTNGSLFLGKFSETQTVLIFGLCLIILTIVIRWFLKKTEQTNNKSKEIENQ